MVKSLTVRQKTWVQSLGQEDPLEKEMATHSSVLPWRIPWTEEPGGLQSMGSQRVRHDRATSLSLSLPKRNKTTQPEKDAFYLISHLQISPLYSLLPNSIVFTSISLNNVFTLLLPDFSFKSLLKFPMLADEVYLSFTLPPLLSRSLFLSPLS